MEVVEKGHDIEREGEGGSGIFGGGVADGGVPFGDLDGEVLKAVTSGLQHVQLVEDLLQKLAQDLHHLFVHFREVEQLDAVLEHALTCGILGHGFDDAFNVININYNNINVNEGVKDSVDRQYCKRG